MTTFVVVDHCTMNNVVLMDYIQLKMDGMYLSVSQGNHTVLNSSCFINNISHDYMDVLYLQNFLKIKNLNFEFSSRENEN